MRNSLPSVAIAAICLGLAFIGVLFFWYQAGLELSLHGWIAYGLGCAVSFALALGLFFLTFKSSRDGYDETQLPEHLDE